MSKGVRKTILKSLDKEVEFIDSAIADLLERATESTDVRPMRNKLYRINGKVCRLVEVLSEDPAVFVFTSKDGDSFEITPYTEVKIDEGRK